MPNETESLAEIEANWVALLDREEIAFRRCVELDRQNFDRTPEQAEAVRKWWSIANAIIWMFVRTRAQHDHELQPFPAFTFGRLANICEELANGNLPSFVEHARARGRALWRKEREHIAYAVLYIEAVRRGEIPDHAPNLTVRRIYNVTDKAVQGWVRRRDEICVGVPHRHLTPEMLAAKMRECGAVYARIGRGAPSDN